MNKKSNFYWLIGIALGTILAFYFLDLHKDIVVSNIAWSCSNKECQVTFRLINQTSHNISCNVSIRALREITNREIQSGSMKSSIMSKKYLKVDLRPNECRTFDETLKTYFPYNPFVIQVNAWRKKSD